MDSTLKTIGVFTLLLLLPVTLSAQSALNDLGFSGQFFFSYERTFENVDVNNEFLLKRGYITFRRDISDRVKIRFTQDVTVDQEGDGEGDIELRLKYALVNIAMKDSRLIKNSSVEFGVVSRPWIDFEQDINDFRSQRSMFLDYNKILSSADYGITYAGQLGEDLPESKQTGIRSAPGRYGSFSIGVYNGGGYAALEKNNNKLIEGRLSIRPLADNLPGFQTSFIGSFGKGNIPESPDFSMGALALSYETQKWIGILQGFTGTGDAAGNFVDQNVDPIDLNGWSLFNEFKPFDFPVSLTFRFDELNNRDQSEWHTRKFVTGLAYVFSNRSKIILDYDRSWYNEVGGSRAVDTIEIITEIRF
ncbi:hypothetical protein [Rhodohalobacter halophilus]|uniref:hypothetical protein n=1 Tax=Rhodohalobacter halophilus TaxID=1812810 RepID=UPI00083F78E4|nr:hypothetical protein [Rhodohalobacter halophilus]